MIVMLPTISLSYRFCLQMALRGASDDVDAFDLFQRLGDEMEAWFVQAHARGIAVLGKGVDQVRE